MEAPPRTQRSIRELRMVERATQGPLPTDFANSTKEVDSQVSAKCGGLALRKQTGQDVDWSALSEQTKRVAQVISETNARSGAQLGHQHEKYRQLTEAQGTAHAETRDNRPDAMRRHAQEMRQLVRDLQPEHRVAVANGVSYVWDTYLSLKMMPPPAEAGTEKAAKPSALVRRRTIV